MATQPFGDGTRRALLIGTGTYDHPELSALRSPEVDCTRLEALLGDTRIGAFEVRTLIDADRSTVEQAIADLFLGARGDDVRLLYLSGHGVQSPLGGKLHFALRETNPNRPDFTTISATSLHEIMDECRARSIVVILDCCYSGLFLPGAKGDASPRFAEALAGRGRVIITAGTRAQAAWEGPHLDTGTPAPSLFTGTLIDGISTGTADLDGDGVVGLQELYRFACERLHHEGAAQTPCLGGEVHYDIALAKVRRKRKPRSSPTGGTGSRSRGAAAPRSPQRPEPWRTRAAEGPARQPVLSDGVLVVHAPYRLHAIDLASRRRSPLIKMWYPSSPALHGDAAYITDKEGHVQMTDLRTGRRRRSSAVAVRDGLLGISQGVLYAPTQDGAVRTFTPSTLEPLAPLTLEGITVTSAPREAAGYTLFTAASSRMRGDPADFDSDRVVAVSEGRVVWSYTAGTALSPDWSATSLGIYVALRPEGSSPSQRIVAVSPENGEVLWSFDTTARLTSTPVATDGVMVFGDMDNRLVALDTRTGIPLWDKEIRTDGRLLTGPSLADGALFTADRAAKLVKRDLLTGRRIRSHDLLVGPDRQGSLTVSKGVVYATDARGDVHAVPM
ncbi:caspase, EACC1-associated type [Streptomyces tagetis]|uniref:PQQ-binding-like beta-propeller repeat protein n=1 Tax=Streptomyces tagetis TaxID=2820809 RepID=A0A940XCW6_9ACTN|nr:PQQ-binding-like beta-propeller repeat protein [Streptomyces sp. RG38]MBQ0826095.1 PQQ-binding-like beta-propeller repeat protein [Streptomyces sp. RG38]